MKWWPFRKQDDEAITDALNAIHRAVEEKPVIEELERRMEESLSGVDKRIEQNHFYEAFAPSWTPKESHA